MKSSRKTNTELSANIRHDILGNGCVEALYRPDTSKILCCCMVNIHCDFCDTPAYTHQMGKCIFRAGTITISAGNRPKPKSWQTAFLKLVRTL